MTPGKKERAMFGLTVKATVLAALMVLSAGCGKGEYETLMTKKMNQLSFSSKFLESLHQDPTEVVQEVASLQLPVATGQYEITSST